MISKIARNAALLAALSLPACSNSASGTGVSASNGGAAAAGAPEGGLAEARAKAAATEISPEAKAVKDFVSSKMGAPPYEMTKGLREMIAGAGADEAKRGKILSAIAEQAKDLVTKASDADGRIDLSKPEGRVGVMLEVFVTTFGDAK